MKYFLLLFVGLFAPMIQAQSELKFDKTFLESADHWVALPQNKDGAYGFGYIYIDVDAGLTFDLAGTFTVLSDGKFLVSKSNQKSSMKYRLNDPNNVKVAFIPESKFKELEISAVPDWMKFYNADPDSAAMLYRKGFIYNAWGKCRDALGYLKQAEKVDPKYPPLAVELSFSYNCLGDYADAQKVLAPEVLNKPQDAYVNKEYIFALVKAGQLESAIAQYKKSVQTLKDNQFNAENCYNILQAFYLKKDKKNFDEWYKELQKQPNDNEMIKQGAEQMNKEMSVL